MPNSRYPWARWTDERLLLLRFKDLGLKLEGTWVQDCIDELHGELEDRGLRLKPHVWVSDEWFSPGGVSGFAVPFYLLHPRLMKLERSQLIEIDGGQHHAPGTPVRVPLAEPLPCAPRRRGDVEQSDLERARHGARGRLVVLVRAVPGVVVAGLPVALLAVLRLRLLRVLLRILLRVLLRILRSGDGADEGRREGKSESEEAGGSHRGQSIRGSGRSHPAKHGRAHSWVRGRVMMSVTAWRGDLFS